jgi:hypothetical protein
VVSEAVTDASDILGRPSISSLAIFPAVNSRKWALVVMRHQGQALLLVMHVAVVVDVALRRAVAAV